jgi:aminopeptidase N
MCRDAELHPADYVTLALSGVGVETDLTAVQGVLNQARTAIDSYAPRDARPALNDRFVTGLARLLKDAEPGSDHQLAFARSLISAARSEAVVGVLQAWLAGDEAPAGLAIDADLRWHIVTNLARVGVAGEAEIAAEQARDATAQGAEKAAGARASRPTAEAKAEAWRLATADDSVANETHFQICSHFWQFDQDEVLQPYIQSYLDVTQAISDGRDGWAERSSAIRQHVLGLLFPRTLADRPTLQLMALWLQGAKLSDSVLRQVDERRDDAERSLRCQEAAAAR